MLKAERKKTGTSINYKGLRLKGKTGSIDKDEVIY
jgi:hypothetical protein